MIPEVLVNEIISPILELLKGNLLDHKTNAEWIDGYIDKKVDQLNSAKINCTPIYILQALIEWMKKKNNGCKKTCVDYLESVYELERRNC